MEGSRYLPWAVSHFSTCHLEGGTCSVRGEGKQVGGDSKEEVR